MHGYLIVGTGEEEVEKKVGEMIGELDGRRMDFEVRKIAEVRELGKFTNLGVTEKTVVVLSGFDEASEAAQNALLKELEEPQENLLYILTASSEDSLLPTVVSRVEVVDVESGKGEIKEKKDARQFLDGEVGERLGITSKINKREDAVEFLESVMIVGRGKMKAEPKLAELIEKAGESLLAIKRNGNVQLQLTNLVVQLG